MQIWNNFFGEPPGGWCIKGGLHPEVVGTSKSPTGPAGTGLKNQEAANRSTKRRPSIASVSLMFIYARVYDLDRAGDGVCIGLVPSAAYTICLPCAWTSERVLHPVSDSTWPVHGQSWVVFTHSPSPSKGNLVGSFSPHIFHPWWKHKCENSFLPSYWSSLL